MEKEIYVSRCLPNKNGANTEIEKCSVNSIEEGRDYIQKIGWKLISPDEPFENIERIEIYDRVRSITGNEMNKTGFIERYIR